MAGRRKGGKTKREKTGSSRRRYIKTRLGFRISKPPQEEGRKKVVRERRGKVVTETMKKVEILRGRKSVIKYIS